MNKGHIILSGSKKIIFSAPHAVEQTRDGKIKCAEAETALIVEKLNEMGYPCIIKTENVGDDANFDLECAYKDDLVKFIRENGIVGVIDLHQLSPLREQDICLGTGGEDCLNLLGHFDVEKELQAHFAKYFTNVTVNNPFGAKGEGTISRYISSRCDIPCVQVELNSKIFLENQFTFDQLANIFDEATDIWEMFDEKNLVD